MTRTILSQGAEATIARVDGETVSKVRLAKEYRHPKLDSSLRKTRTRAEAKVLQTVSKHNISVPLVKKVDDKEMILELEFISGEKLRDCLTQSNCDILGTQLGDMLAKMHNLDIIHSDLTTSNMILRDGAIVLIDFGLAYFSTRTEDKAVDLHLLRQALESYHYAIASDMYKAVLTAYKKEIKDPDVLSRLAVVERRGKNKQ